MYVIHHYTAGVILFGKKSVCDRQGLEKVHFENYKGALSFVHVNGNHWRFLMARVVLEAFPDDPTFTFGTSKEEMASQRKVMGCQILEGSVFDHTNNVHVQCAQW